MTTNDQGRQPASHVSFRLYSDDLSPDQLTALIGLQPDDVCRQGDIGPIGPYPANGWFLSSQTHVAPDDPLDAHLEWLLATLEPCVTALDRARELGCDIDVIGSLRRGAADYWLVLEPALLARLAALDLEIAVAIDV